MIGVRAAVDAAVEFARGVLDAERTNQLRLEEVETTGAEGAEQWLITLSMPEINSFGFPSVRREYKTFTVDGKTGKVLSMKIREVASAA